VNDRIHTRVFDNGLTLVAEEMDWLESAALSIRLPAGCIYDPIDRIGIANFTSDMVQRGCGELDSRQFLEAMERLGVSFHSSVGSAHSSYGGAMVADQLPAAMSLFAKLIREPLLPADQMEASRQVCFQELRGIEDSLEQRVFMELYRRIYPDPWGRSCYGSFDTVGAINHADVTNHVVQYYGPQQAIMSVAGKIKWRALGELVEQKFGDWQAGQVPVLEELPCEQGYHHIQVDSAQTHIGVAFPSVSYADPDYFQARGAVGVLSDGMSSRLFTEIREKQGLCYTVGASCHSLRDRGTVIAYSATSTERAQQTLDSLIFELMRLSEGVQQDELDRLKAQIKSTLIMQQESSYSRSGTIAGDMYYLGRVRSIEEISSIIDRLTCDTINAYLAAHPARDFTIVTLGARELSVPI
jgi:predicted Zn-dependent peptidase